MLGSKYTTRSRTARWYYVAGRLERTLAVRLGAPIHGCDPELSQLGSTSGSRRVFREVGIPFPDGFEDPRDANDVARVLTELKRRNPSLDRAVVKLNDGFSEEGNAVFPYRDTGGEVGIPDLRKGLCLESVRETWESYEPKLVQMGGIVEAFIGDGGKSRSPSVQCRINPVGEAEVISTHE